MDSVLRALVVDLFLLVVFRLAGRRSLSQVTTFDLILALIISEAIQQALIDNDDTLTNAFVVVLTLVAVDVLLSVLKQRSDTVERVLEGIPVVIAARGGLRTKAMDMERVDESDILEAGREAHGLRSLDDVDYAVIERGGAVTVVPKS